MSLARARALAVLGVLSLVAVLAVVWALTRDSVSNAAAPAGCVSSSVAPVTAVPSSPAQVQVRVYNATDRSGLAVAVSTELKRRRFTVAGTGNDPKNGTVAGPAELRHGPAGAGAAHLLRGQFLGAKMVADSRADATVDVVLGSAYKAMATDTQARAELARLGAPSAPPRC